MFWFFMICLTLVIASPISQESNELTPTDDDLTDGLEVSIPKNPLLVDCTSNSFPNNNFNGDNENDNAAIYRRGNYCPSTDLSLPPEPRELLPKKYDPPANKHPLLKYGTCNSKYSVLLTCGGPEIMTGDDRSISTQYSNYVANCIAGKFFMFTN